MQKHFLTYWIHRLNKFYFKSFYHLFIRENSDIAATQEDILTRLLYENRNTIYGKRHRFRDIKNPEQYQARVPIVEYEDLIPYIESVQDDTPAVLTRSRVLRLIPSSGTSSASKRIPYTRALQKDFSKAVFAWLYNLYRCYPELGRGKFFWIISPVVRPAEKNSKVPVEFAEDRSYFGKAGQWLIDQIMAVPPFLSQIEDMDSYYYLLAWFLLRKDDLSLISVWNPSLLLILMKKMIENKERLISDIRSGTLSPQGELSARLRRISGKYRVRDPRRAEVLAQCFSEADSIYDPAWETLWPNLKLISSWGDSWAKGNFQELQRLFPNVICQKKGLLMTEGVISIPIIDEYRRISKTVLCPHVHFYEFIEQDSGGIYFAHQLEQGKRYEVVLSTSGGLYRYRTHDIVRFEGKRGGQIVLNFEGKNNVVSDLMGEKLNAFHVEKVLAKLELSPSVHSRCFLAPTITGEETFYTLFVEYHHGIKSLNRDHIRSQLDDLLKENFHYKNCRALKQLSEPRIAIIEQGTLHNIFNHFKTHRQIGTLKEIPLLTDPAITGLLLSKKTKPCEF